MVAVSVIGARFAVFVHVVTVGASGEALTLGERPRFNMRADCS
jgi:hypothetical protein